MISEQDVYAALKSVAGPDGKTSLPETGAIERVANRPSVGKMRLHPAYRDVFSQRLPRRGAQLVVQFLQHALGDRKQFAVLIVGEVDVMRHARAETRV